MVTSAPSSSGVDRSTFISWYRRNRERSRMLFDLLADEAYYSQPIALRHPIVFYEGHLPAFSFNTLVKRALGGASIDPQLEQLFARGIDPGEADAPRRPARDVWPARDVVRGFVEEADRRVLAVLEREELDRPGHPLLNRMAAVFAILEHEAMHQETLLYMWHRLPFDQKRKSSGYVPRVDGSVPAGGTVLVPPGRATLGVNPEAVPFAWDNECPSFVVDVPAFAIARHDVTNEAFMEFVDAGGYADPQWWRPDDWAWIQQERVSHPLFWQRQDAGWQWRGMFDLIALPPAWPVFVSYAEASAFCRWRGVRLPTEAEFQRAAYGTPEGTERKYPWGSSDATTHRGVFDFTSWDPEPAGSHPQGASAWGVEDLVGNGWEWTSTPFGPFPGFAPLAAYPEYSADFFDEEHFVMKGASPATASELVRPSFRNWFRARYPYVYATFRGVQDVR
jgi:iron(II)-dependent oxidoreductase